MFAILTCIGLIVQHEPKFIELESGHYNCSYFRTLDSLIWDQEFEVTVDGPSILISVPQGGPPIFIGAYRINQFEFENWDSAKGEILSPTEFVGVLDGVVVFYFKKIK